MAKGDRVEEKAVIEEEIEKYNWFKGFNGGGLVQNQGFWVVIIGTVFIEGTTNIITVSDQGNDGIDSIELHNMTNAGQAMIGLPRFMLVPPKGFVSSPGGFVSCIACRTLEDALAIL